MWLFFTQVCLSGPPVLPSLRSEALRGEGSSHTRSVKPRRGSVIKTPFTNVTQGRAIRSWLSRACPSSEAALLLDLTATIYGLNQHRTELIRLLSANTYDSSNYSTLHHLSLPLRLSSCCLFHSVHPHVGAQRCEVTSLPSGRYNNLWGLVLTGSEHLESGKPWTVCLR